MWETRKGTLEYEDFVKGHECPINHVGSAGAMEVSGVVKIYEKSVKNLKLCFTSYIGDGDSKAYPTAVKAKPNGQDKEIKGWVICRSRA